MAEFVEQKIQEMIPEVEEMERIGLLSIQEIKKLIEKRRDFEYRISRPMKMKEDFISYVLFDSKLLDCITLRRKISSMSLKFQKIDMAISRRVMKRLRYMSRIWPSHFDVWELRISFSKSQKFDDEVSTAFAELVRFHGNDEDVWVKWAQWEIEGRSNFEKARSILLSKATLYHPKSLALTREYFRLELLYVEHLNKMSQLKNIEGLEEIAKENRDKILSCALPEAIYQNAKQKFETPEMYLQFYSVVERFKFANWLKKKIYRETVTKYPMEEIIYKLQAKRLLSGLPSEPVEEKSEENLEANKEGIEKIEKNDEKLEKTEKNDEKLENIEEQIELSPIKKITAIITMYDKAIDSVGQNFLKTYIEELFDLLYQCWGLDDYTSIIFSKIFELFETFSNTLPRNYFLIWYLMQLHLKNPSSILKRILFAAKASYPDCPVIKLHWIKFRFSLKPDFVYNQKKFLEGVSGKMGVKLCMTLIDHERTKENYKEKLFKKAAYHTDVTVAKWMRINHIESLTDVDDMKLARSLYKTYCFLPPFSVELHICMILKELTGKKVWPKRVRNVFEIAVKQFGQSHIGMWLSFIEFERKFGNKENIPIINQEAEETLAIEKYQSFIDLKFYLQNLKAKNMSGDQILVEDRINEDDCNEQFWDETTLGSIFVEPPILTYSAIEDRKMLFLSMSEVVSAEEDSLQKWKAEKSWEKLLSFILNEPVSLKVKKIDLSEIGLQHDTKLYLIDSEKKFNKIIEKRQSKLSDSLAPSVSTVTQRSTDEVELQKILKSSEILQPEFLKQKQIIPYYINKKSQKKINKKKKAETKGEGWFNMKAPEITPEVRRDLAILKMRSVLHPDRHYKRNDMKETPKYFQLGKVLDSPLDFYSGRVPMKERKRTLAEEIMNEEEVLRYQKRKYSEIIERRDQRKRKRSEFMKIEKMKKLNKNKDVIKKVSKASPKHFKKRKTIDFSQE